MKTRVNVVKDLPELKLVGRQLGPAPEGKEIEVESWEAPILEKHGFAEPVQKITVAEVRRQILAEERASTLEKLPQDFYARVGDRAEHLRESGQMDQLVELQEAMSALAEMRAQKLAHLAASGVEAKGLLPEEQFLLNRLVTALDNWKEWLDNLLGGEVKEEVGEHGGKIGESVRHAVGDSADIQEERVSPTDVHT